MYRHVMDAKMLTVLVWLAYKNVSLCDQWFMYPTLPNFGGTLSWSMTSVLYVPNLMLLSQSEELFWLTTAL